MNGMALGAHDPYGEPITDDSFFLCFNAHYEPLNFALPEGVGDRWVKVLDTHEVTEEGDESEEVKAGNQLRVEARSLVVLRLTNEAEPS